MNKTDVKWLNTINEIITRNFTNEEFTIDKMAEEMAISRSNLQRKLKGLTGMPPNDYIRLIRLKTAGELLREEGGLVRKMRMMRKMGKMRIRLRS